MRAHLISCCVGLLLTGCASAQRVDSWEGAESVERADAEGDKLIDDTPLVQGREVKRRFIAAPLVKLPRTQQAARLHLEKGLAAMKARQPAIARAHFTAVLATDFLTDGGRLNVYWFAAEAARDLGDRQGEASALEGFVLAAQLMPKNEGLRERELLARTTLAAHRVQTDPVHGRTPQKAIVIEDVREPGTIISTLTCGPRGDDRYVNVAIETEASPEGQLIHRKATCRTTGRVLELYFVHRR